MGMANTVGEGAGLLADDSAETGRCRLGVLRRRPYDPRAALIVASADLNLLAVCVGLGGKYEVARINARLVAECPNQSKGRLSLGHVPAVSTMPTGTRSIRKRSKPHAPSAASAPAKSTQQSKWRSVEQRSCQLR